MNPLASPHGITAKREGDGATSRVRASVSVRERARARVSVREKKARRAANVSFTLPHEGVLFGGAGQ
jgi:hypothetical protein